MAKRTREQAVKDKRALKLERKQAVAAAKRDGTWVPETVEGYDENGLPLEPDADDDTEDGDVALAADESEAEPAVQPLAASGD